MERTNNNKSPPHLTADAEAEADADASKEQKITSTTMTKDVLNDDHGLVTLMYLPVNVRVTILNHLGGETQDDLINLILVSKQFYNDCKRPGIGWKIIPTIEIRPDPHQVDDSIRGLLLMRNLAQHLLNNETKEKLQSYSHMIIKDVQKFVLPKYDGRDIQFDWILSLDITNSSSQNGIDRPHSHSGIIHQNDYIILSMLPHRSILSMLPNLLEINISGKIVADIVNFDSSYSPRLEKITWSNLYDSYVDMDNFIWFSCNKNLKEIYMDDVKFHGSLPNKEFNNCIIFQKCKSLERVSIRKTTWHGKSFPQDALIEFVRYHTSLRWFRSDLTHENMDMLRLERPGIELLN
jgi:hypothetical protein